MLGSCAVLSTWKRDEGALRTATVIAVTCGIALNLVLVSVVESAFPALHFFPQAETAARSAQAPTAGLMDVARASGKSPAEVVVAQILATPPQLPGGATAVSALQGAPSSPVDLVCGPRTGPGPVVAAGRGWTVASGSQVTNFQAGYTVTVSAYGAGQGAVAFAALAAQVNEHCANTSGTAYLVGSTGAGVDAATAWVSRPGGATTAFFWRRGDIVAMVAASGPSVAMDLVKEYDARVAAALAGVCTNTGSTLADAARSPYVTKTGFTGLTITAPVGLPYGVAPPAQVEVPPAQVLPVVALPIPPEAPFWPAALPSPVVAPSEPTPPAYPALTTTAPVRVQDDQGPGCGWAFTGQPVPGFDEATAARRAALDADKAAAGLAAGVDAYTANVPAYRAAYTTYLAGVLAFQQYAQAVDAVSAAWGVIRTDQADFKLAMVLYTAATASRDRFLAARAAAQVSYAKALAACAARTSAPPIPEVTVVPTVSPTPTPAPTTAPTTAPVMVCPPVRAPIITQPVPTPPLKPTAPADPRPTGTVTPTR